MKQPSSHLAFPKLPLELFLNVLDQLVSTSNGQQPLAYSPSNPTTKTLRALTLVSRNTYIIASRYLYSNCLYLETCTSYACFRRTLALPLGHHPQALEYGEAGRNDALFMEAEIQRHITSLFISPMEVQRSSDGKTTPLVRLPQIIDLCSTIGSTLKRLALDFGPILATPSQVALISPHVGENNIFAQMRNLEDLVVSYHVTGFFRYPPPNLKRLAITTQDMSDIQTEFCACIPSLRILVFLRPVELTAENIDTLFTLHASKNLDIVLVDINSNHGTPPRARNWDEDDTVRIWEVDVPVSFYGDDSELILCDNWIWTHAVRGTLWSHEKRRMIAWADIERRLTGPVHMIVDGVHE